MTTWGWGGFEKKWKNIQNKKKKTGEKKQNQIAVTPPTHKKRSGAKYENVTPPTTQKKSKKQTTTNPQFCKRVGWDGSLCPSTPKLPPPNGCLLCRGLLHGVGSGVQGGQDPTKKKSTHKKRQPGVRRKILMGLFHFGLFWWGA